MSETAPETRQKLKRPAWKPDGNPMETGLFPAMHGCAFGKSAKKRKIYTF
jgi:hypothetical protein